MIPVRRDDWQSRLSAVIAARLQTPFEWGVNDCALFAADAVLAMTDMDLAADQRGRYTTKVGALRCLHRLGFKDQVSLAASFLPEIAPALTTDGDLAVIEGPDGPILGVIAGALIAAPGPDGLNFEPRNSAVAAFRIPFSGEVG